MKKKNRKMPWRLFALVTAVAFAAIAILTAFEVHSQNRRFFQKVSNIGNYPLYPVLTDSDIQKFESGELSEADLFNKYLYGYYAQLSHDNPYDNTIGRTSALYTADGKTIRLPQQYFAFYISQVYDVTDMMDRTDKTDRTVVYTTVTGKPMNYQDIYYAPVDDDMYAELMRLTEKTNLLKGCFDGVITGFRKENIVYITSFALWEDSGFYFVHRLSNKNLEIPADAEPFEFDTRGIVYGMGYVSAPTVPGISRNAHGTIDGTASCHMNFNWVESSLPVFQDAEEALSGLPSEYRLDAVPSEQLSGARKKAGFFTSRQYYLTDSGRLRYNQLVPDYGAVYVIHPFRLAVAKLKTVYIITGILLAVFLIFSRILYRERC